jgi:hypothetical protein
LHSFPRAAFAALILIVGAGSAAAHGTSHEARVREQSAPPCGWSGGALADPAQTQRCLAERYKAAKQKPATNAATAAPASAPTSTN